MTTCLTMCHKSMPHSASMSPPSHMRSHYPDVSVGCTMSVHPRHYRLHRPLASTCSSSAPAQPLCVCLFRSYFRVKLPCQCHPCHTRVSDTRVLTPAPCLPPPRSLVGRVLRESWRLGSVVPFTARCHGTVSAVGSHTLPARTPIISAYCVANTGDGWTQPNKSVPRRGDGGGGGIWSGYEWVEWGLSEI